MRRLADGGSPGLEQHIHRWERPDPEQLMPRLVWRDLLDAERAANHPVDGGHLLKLAQRVRSGQNIFRPRVSVLAQRARRDYVGSIRRAPSRSGRVC